MRRTVPRTVLMTADAVGGVWRYALELAAGLAENGVRVVLAVMGPPPSEAQRQEASRVPGLVLVEAPYRLEWMAGAAEDLVRAGEWLLDLEARWRPDVVHLNGYAHAVLPWQAPVLVVAHSCVLSWWRAVKGCSIPGEWNAYAATVGRGLRAADVVAAPTGAFLREIDRLYGPLRAARVVRNGVAPGRFVPVANKDPVVFAAGRVWDEAKNLAVLSRVAESLPWPVAIAGDCVSPEGRVRRPPGVQVLGPLAPEAMARQMARASVFAAPALYEPFGLAVLEAALSGCALVLSDIATFRELWDGAAVFVHPDDADGWEEALSGLVHDSDRRGRLQREARERALEYSRAAMTAGTLDIYRDIGATAAPSANAGAEGVSRREGRDVLSFPVLGLESRERPLPARHRP